MPVSKEIDIRQVKALIRKTKIFTSPVNIKIVELLEVNEKMNVTQIYEKLNIYQALASLHLKVMKSAKFIKAERKGQNIYYSLNRSAIDKFLECIYELAD